MNHRMRLLTLCAIFALVLGLQFLALAQTDTSQISATTSLKEGNQPETHNAAPSEAGSVKGDAAIHFCVLYFNDIHGNLLPFTTKQDDQKVEVGGIARLAALAKDIRTQNQKKGIATFLLIAGDILQGTPLSTVFKGKPDVECFNAMGVNAITVGNHEFDFGLDNFLALKSQAKFPFISCNISWKDSGELLCAPLTSFMLAKDITLSVIGVTTQRLMTTTKASNAEKLAVSDEVESVQKIFPAVKDKGPVILLSHSGSAEDEVIAGKLPELAAIIGGHDQILLNPYKKVGEVPIFQAFEKGRYLGRLDLSVDPATKRTKLEDYTYFPITPAITADPEIDKIVTTYASQLDVKFKEVIGESLVFLDGEREHIRYEETALGDFVTDVMREYTGAQIALFNGGGLRASINEGPVKVEDVMKAMPYDNELVVVELTGDEIMQVLQRAYKSARQEEDGGFLHISGLRVTIKDRKPEQVLVGSDPLDPKTTYRVAIPDFLASGGDGFPMFAGKPSYKTGSPLRELIIDTVRAKGKVSARVDGRIQRVGE